MEATLIRVIILGVIFGLTEGVSVLPDGPLNATVDDTVTFTTTLAPTQTPFLGVEWHFGPKRIIFSRESNITAPEYVGRITLFISTGSLELRNVSLNDTGEYRVSITPQVGPLKTGFTRMNIYVPVFDVRVTVNNTQLVEFSSIVTLSCSSSGSPVSFLWLNGSSEVTAIDRVQFTDGGSTLTIVTVTQYDHGPFRCHVSNPISNVTSDPVHFSISYGPHNVKVIGSTKLEVGQSLVLMCSAESTPAASYSWIINGEMILNGSAVFVKPVTETSDSGVYICEARNSVTGRSSSGEHSLSVQVFQEPEGLGGGVTAGIVIGCLLVVGLAVGGAFCGYKAKKKKKKVDKVNMNEYNSKPQSPQNEQEDSIYENTSSIYENKI